MHFLYLNFRNVWLPVSYNSYYLSNFKDKDHRSHRSPEQPVQPTEPICISWSSLLIQCLTEKLAKSFPSKDYTCVSICIGLARAPCSLQTKAYQALRFCNPPPPPCQFIDALFFFALIEGSSLRQMSVV